MWPLFISFTATANEFAALEAWNVYKTSKNITVWFRKTDHSPLIEIKTRTQINSTLSGFLLFIQDTQNATSWLDNVVESEVLEMITPTSNIIKTRFNTLWPLSPRVMMIKSHYWQNQDLTVEIAIEDAKDEQDKNEDEIFVDILSAHWKITPTHNNSLTIEYQFIANANGDAPHWLVNRMALRSTWKTLKDLHQQLPTSRWQMKRLPNIVELEETNVNLQKSHD